MNREPASLYREKGIMRFSHPAMATVFEVIIANEDLSFAEQCARAAFEEIDRLEGELSRFLPNSDIARVNNLAPGKSIRVGMDAFECLRLSKKYSRDTSGAFDVTIGSLMDRLLRNNEDRLRHSDADTTGSGDRVGMELIHLDQSNYSVSVGRVTPQVDLGAIGKGYAVDRVSELLREWGVGSALVHGGGSSAFAFGDCPETCGWPVTISSPVSSGAVVENIHLRQNALSGSGVVRRSHIVDPRSGGLIGLRLGAWVCAATGAESDAISTACMIMEEAEIDRYRQGHPGTWAMICEEGATGGGLRFVRFGERREDIRSSA